MTFTEQLALANDLTFLILLSVTTIPCRKVQFLVLFSRSGNNAWQVQPPPCELSADNNQWLRRSLPSTGCSEQVGVGPNVLPFVILFGSLKVEFQPEVAEKAQRLCCSSQPGFSVSLVERGWASFCARNGGRVCLMQGEIKSFSFLSASLVLCS